MIDLLLLNKISVIVSICLIIVSFFVLKTFIFRPANRPVRQTDENVDDDDMTFPTHVDKRSLRPSYGRFMRRKLQQELTNDSYFCVICLNERKTVVLLPCKHLCVCVSCSKNLRNANQNETCPICRTEIESLLEVFL